jgi:cell wall assembly regulator SMI1
MWQPCPVAIDWHQFLSADDGCQLRRGASASDIAAVEAALEAVFPADLRELYLFSDGVFDAPGQWL